MPRCFADRRVVSSKPRASRNARSGGGYTVLPSDGELRD